MNRQVFFVFDKDNVFVFTLFVEYKNNSEWGELLSSLENFYSKTSYKVEPVYEYKYPDLVDKIFETRAIRFLRYIGNGTFYVP